VFVTDDGGFKEFAVVLVWHVVFDCCLHLNSETRCFVAVGIAGFGAASTDDDPNGGLI
jgi:hypothetical protein